MFFSLIVFYIFNVGVWACADTEGMDIDQPMVIPDTPDRVSKEARNSSSTNSFFDSSSRNSGSVNRVVKVRKIQLLGDRNHAGQTYSYPKDNLGDLARSEGARSSAVLSSVEAGKKSKDKDKHRFLHHHLKDEKIPYSKAPYSSFTGTFSSHHHNIREEPIMIENGGIAKFSSKSTRDDLRTRKMDTEFKLPNLHADGTSKSTRNDYKGKMKVGLESPDFCNAPSVKGVDSVCHITSDHDPGMGPSVPFHSSKVPSKIMRKNLVRNGCISPYNIAKDKMLVEASSLGPKIAQCGADSGHSESIVGVDEPSLKPNVACRAKGKGLLINDSPSKCPGGRYLFY